MTNAEQNDMKILFQLGLPEMRPQLLERARKALLAMEAPDHIVIPAPATRFRRAPFTGRRWLAAAAVIVIFAVALSVVIINRNRSMYGSSNPSGNTKIVGGTQVLEIYLATLVQYDTAQQPQPKGDRIWWIPAIDKLRTPFRSQIKPDLRVRIQRIAYKPQGAAGTQPVFQIELVRRDWPVWERFTAKHINKFVVVALNKDLPLVVPVIKSSITEGRMDFADDSLSKPARDALFKMITGKPAPVQPEVHVPAPRSTSHKMEVYLATRLQDSEVKNPLPAGQRIWRVGANDKEHPVEIFRTSVKPDLRLTAARIQYLRMYPESQFIIVLAPGDRSGFAKFTSEHVNKYIVVVYDGVTVTAPVIMAAITDGQISLNEETLTTAERAAFLAMSGYEPPEPQLAPEQTPEEKVPANFSKALIVLPGARDLDCHDNNSIQSVVYSLKEPYPADRALTTIKNSLAKQGWRPLKEDIMNPGLPTSTVRGWTEFVNGTRHPNEQVRAWSSDWQNQAGDIVQYGLSYSSPITGPPNEDELALFAVYFPAEMVKQLQADQKKLPKAK
jgi:hypothetical protein